MTKLGAEQKFELCKVAERKIYVFPLEFFEVTPFRQKPKALTKSSKLIATLGVVAGLGVAALPLGSVFATEAAVSGDVDVVVDVLPAIAMTITGNNDSADDYSSLELYSDGEGHTAGEVIRTEAFTSTETASNAASGGTYTTTTTAKSSSIASLVPNSVVHGTAAANGFKSTVTIWTNDASGYTLGISGVGDLTQTGADPIPATGTVGAGTSSWGYSLTAIDTDWTSGNANYEHADNNDLKHPAGVTPAAGDSTNIFYGVSTNGSQQAGTYTDTITYTATTNS